MTRLLELFAVALVSGLVAPLVLSFLSHRFVWRWQTQTEIKRDIFDKSVKAFSMFVVDALDFKLQSDKPVYQGKVRETERRPETWEIIEETKSMVQAFFSKETYEKVDEAFRAEVSIETIPYKEFEGKRTAAILAMAKELGI